MQPVPLMQEKADKIFFWSFILFSSQKKKKKIQQTKPTKQKTKKNPLPPVSIFPSLFFPFKAKGPKYTGEQRHLVGAGSLVASAGGRSLAASCWAPAALLLAMQLLLPTCLGWRPIQMINSGSCSQFWKLPQKVSGWIFYSLGWVQDIQWSIYLFVLKTILITL